MHPQKTMFEPAAFQVGLELVVYIVGQRAPAGAKRRNECPVVTLDEAMLKAVAGLLGATLRDTDVVARYGGEKFVLLLPGVDSKQAEAVAQRLVKRARETHADNGNGKSFSITLSLGIATSDSRATFSTSQDLLAAADTAIYHSKHNGRNQLTCYDKIKAA